MKNYIVYSRTTGNIIKTGTCPEGTAELQCHDADHAVIEGTANDTTDTIDTETGEILRKSKEA